MRGYPPSVRRECEWSGLVAAVGVFLLVCVLLWCVRSHARQTAPAPAPAPATASAPAPCQQQSVTVALGTAPGPLVGCPCTAGVFPRFWWWLFSKRGRK